ncbi:MAG: hypothetical protein C4343_00990 [Chloroflexota bacterium]
MRLARRSVGAASCAGQPSSAAAPWRQGWQPVPQPPGRRGPSGRQHRVGVVGSHGRRGVERALLGSVSDHVLRHAPCPVLVVGSGVEPTSASVFSDVTRPNGRGRTAGAQPTSGPSQGDGGPSRFRPRARTPEAAPGAQGGSGELVGHAAPSVGAARGGARRSPSSRSGSPPWFWWPWASSSPSRPSSAASPPNDGSLSRRAPAPPEAGARSTRSWESPFGAPRQPV